MSQITTTVNERQLAVTTPCPTELVDATTLPELIEKFGEEIVFSWAKAQGVIAFRSAVRTKAMSKNAETGEFNYSAEEIAEMPWEDWMPTLRKAKNPLDELTQMILKFKTPEAAIAALATLGFSIPAERIQEIFAANSDSED